MFFLSLAAVSAYGATLNGSGRAEPLTKILDTLRNLEKSVEEEQLGDQNDYKSSFGWCQKSFGDRKKGADRYSAIQEELKSKLTVQTAVSRQLKDEVAELENEIAEAKSAVEQGSGLRGSEHEDYIKEQKETARMLGVLNKAVNGLTNAANRESLMSVAASVKEIAASQGGISDSQRMALNDFANKSMMSTNEADDAISQTSNVMQVLKDLINSFQGNMGTASDQEKAALDQYDGLIRMKKNALLQLITAKDTKDALLAESVQKAAQINRSLQDAESLTKAGKGYLETVKKVCGNMSNQYAARSRVFADINGVLQVVVGDLSGVQAQNNSNSSSFLQLKEEKKTALKLKAFQNQQEFSRVSDKEFKNLGEAPTYGEEEVIMPMRTISAPPIWMQERNANKNKKPKFALSFVQVKKEEAGENKVDDALDMVMPDGMSLDLNKSEPAKNKKEDDGGLGAMLAQLQTTQSNMPMKKEEVRSNPGIKDKDSTSQVSLIENLQSSFSSGGGVNNDKSATYSSVKEMVSQMRDQIQAAEMDEDKHKHWCDSELSKNSSMLEEKSTKLKRLSTKIDNEKELVAELDQDLSILNQEGDTLKQEIASFVQLTNESNTRYVKANQNHQVAAQILQQAVLILQRFTALASENAKEQSGYLNQDPLSLLETRSQALVSNLNSAQTKYEQLKEAIANTTNQMKLDVDFLRKGNTNTLNVLINTKNFRTNLRLQNMSELDSDSEDQNALQAQVDSVKKYVSQLQSTCRDILEHYDERKARRAANLKSLDEAQNVISIDNADEIHQKLSSLAIATDAQAAKLVGSSENIADSKNTPKDMLMNVNAAASAVSRSTSDILDDLQGLQDINMGQKEGDDNGLNMLSPM